MANPEHLEILKQGVEVWNRWRKKNPKIIPSLSRASLSKIKLTGINFNGAILNKAKLLEANLSRATFIGAIVTSVNLRSANLSRAVFTKANLTWAKLSGANLTYTNFSNAELTKVDLSGADLSGADLHKATLVAADFSGATIYEVNLDEADLTLAKFMMATLTGGSLHNSTITQAVMGLTSVNGVDLSRVKGLDTIQHVAPSSIGIDTIYRSKGNMPESFLHGCGIPEEIATYMRSLIIQPIQFYSCFISYSSKDHPFAERLHADLQSKGVRCWFAPEDLKIGDRFRDKIDESIRLHDKLLLVLSEHSVSSPWVNDEVEAAIERENREGRTVLFPIKIDEAVMESEQAWAAKIRRTRHVGDFTHWKDHDSYQKAFDRLLRDLKADEKIA